MAKNYGIKVGLTNTDEIKSDFAKLLKDLQNTANSNKIKLIDSGTLKQMEDITKSVQRFKNNNSGTKIFDLADVEKQKVEVLKNIKQVEDKLKLENGKNGVITFENMKMDTQTNQLKSFTAIVTDAKGKVQKLAYEYAKITSGDKVVNKGFVNTDKILTDTTRAVKAKEELIRLEKEHARIANHQEPKTKYYDVKSEEDNAERFRSIAKLQKEIKERNQDAVVSFTTVEDSISNTVTKVVANIKRGTKEAETLNYELMKIRHFDEDGKKTTSYNGYVQTTDKTKMSKDAFDLEKQKKLYKELNSLIKEEYNLKVKSVRVKDDESKQAISEVLKANKERQRVVQETLKTEKLIDDTLQGESEKVKRAGEDKLKIAGAKPQSSDKPKNELVDNLVQYDIFRRGLDLTFRKLREGVGFVYDFNKSLTEISIVTGKNQEQVASLGKEYVALGKSMKVSSQEVAQASVEYYRQGLAQNEVDNRMKQTIQFSKVANVGLKDSAEILTATVNSMEIDMKRATDVFTFMGDATATGKIVPLISVMV